MRESMQMQMQNASYHTPTDVTRNVMGTPRFDFEPFHDTKYLRSTSCSRLRHASTMSMAEAFSKAMFPFVSSPKVTSEKRNETKWNGTRVSGKRDERGCEVKREGLTRERGEGNDESATRQLCK